MFNLMGQRIGNYEIVARFGEGGMAAVYKARQINIKREVAIKVILPTLAQRDEFTKRFEKEAELCAALSHPHIVKIFDYGVVRGFHLRLMDAQADPRKDVYYLVMELLSGGSLIEKLRRGPLNAVQTVRILKQVGSALDYANGRGLIHRDLKPGNVLFDGQENAFLTDFGIAKLVNETTGLTEEGMTMGTPSYMAPEMWESDVFTPSIDIYALGVLMFEMLTGRLPFIANTPYRVMNMHINDQPPSVYDFAPNLPPGLDSIIRRAMAKKAEDRYPTATAMVVELEALLAGSAAIQSTVLQPIPPKAPAAGNAVVQSAASSAPNYRAIMVSGAILIIGLIALLIILLSNGPR